MGYIGASIYCNIGASNALSKEGNFRDSRRDLGQLIMICVIVIWVIPNVFFAGAKPQANAPRCGKLVRVMLARANVSARMGLELGALLGRCVIM